MHRDLEGALAGAAAYEELPESFRGTFSHREWLWMTDQQKTDLTRRECEPEWSEP
ncbi:MAG: hypothetical protein MUF54_00155 [Polyangiaceae bacterium]|jgi:hypothetical protein|nr:hypothetical protein [Polyangiaceae bacterium]